MSSDTRQAAGFFDDYPFYTIHAAAAALVTAYNYMADSVNVSHSHILGVVEKQARARANYMLGTGLRSLATRGWVPDDAIRTGDRP